MYPKSGPAGAIMMRAMPTPAGLTGSGSDLHPAHHDAWAARMMGSIPRSRPSGGAWVLQACMQLTRACTHACMRMVSADPVRQGRRGCGRAARHLWRAGRRAALLLHEGACVHKAYACAACSQCSAVSARAPGLGFRIGPPSIAVCVHAERVGGMRPHMAALRPGPMHAGTGARSHARMLTYAVRCGRAGDLGRGGPAPAHRREV